MALTDGCAAHNTRKCFIYTALVYFASADEETRSKLMLDYNIFKWGMSFYTYTFVQSSPGLCTTVLCK